MISMFNFDISIYKWQTGNVYNISLMVYKSIKPIAYVFNTASFIQDIFIQCTWFVGLKLGKL